MLYNMMAGQNIPMGFPVPHNPIIMSLNPNLPSGADNMVLPRGLDSSQTSLDISSSRSIAAHDEPPPPHMSLSATEIDGFKIESLPNPAMEASPKPVEFQLDEFVPIDIPTELEGSEQ